VIKKKWGKKLACQECGAKFYDLNKKRPTCPKCAAEHKGRKLKPRRTSPLESSRPLPETKEQPQTDEEIVEVELDDEIIKSEEESQDGTIIEDASEIGGDEEDIEEVLGAVEENKNIKE